MRDRVDRSGGDGDRFERGEQVVAGAPGGRGLNRGEQCVPVFEAKRIGRVARIVLIQPHGAAETAELRVVADRQDEPAVDARKHRIGAHVHVRVADARRGDAADEPVHRLIR